MFAQHPARIRIEKPLVTEAVDDEEHHLAGLAKAFRRREGELGVASPPGAAGGAAEPALE